MHGATPQLENVQDLGGRQFGHVPCLVVAVGSTRGITNTPPELDDRPQ